MIATVAMDDQHWNQVLNVLAAAPYRDVAQVIKSIAEQVSQQQQAQASATQGNVVPFEGAS